MKTKATLISVLTGVLVLALSPAVWAGGAIEARQSEQRAAIYQAMKSGRISEAEFADLDSEQYEIETFRREAFSDGYLDRGERRMLSDRLSRAGRSIRQVRTKGFRGQYADWKWDPRYDRYHYRDYWDHYYRRGPYHCHRPRRPPHYRRPPRRPRPVPYYPPRRPPHHRRPPQIRPYGYINIGIHQPGFELGWSIGLR